jgi:hypothetical protein
MICISLVSTLRAAAFCSNCMSPAAAVDPEVKSVADVAGDVRRDAVRQRGVRQQHIAGFGDYLQRLADDRKLLMQSGHALE